MKTKLLRKIRKRFEYKFSPESKYYIIYIWDKKRKSIHRHDNIKDAIHLCLIEIGYNYLYHLKTKSTIRRNRKYFDSLK